VATSRRFVERVSLRHLLFLLLLVSGLIPLATISFLLTRQNLDILESQEQDYLNRSTRELSGKLSTYLETVTRQVEQLGEGFLALPGPEVLAERLRLDGASRYFGGFMEDNFDRVLLLRVLDLEGQGPALGPTEIGAQVIAALDETFSSARQAREPVYRFVRSEDNQPFAVLAMPLFAPRAIGAAARPDDEPPAIIMEALVRFDAIEGVLREQMEEDSNVFLIDAQGNVLWTDGADDATSRAVAASGLVSDFVGFPLTLTREYSIFVEGGRQRMLGRISPVQATGWGLLIQKPLAGAYAAASRLIVSAVVSSAVLILLSMVFGMVAAKRFSAPFQGLIETTHEIAAGNFDRRVAVTGPGREIVELAEDFNRMGEHVDRYVDRLKAAAQENRELFISSIRAFAAAVDAKDPYTRGHSERVASYSRTISSYLGQSEEFQQRIWISGVLHDVGKIGIEDHVLKKNGVLTNEEYEIMKLHPVIGAEIIAPIAKLKEMIPAVRWHHESWNGKGYPDGLKGEEIPLIARIVAVADTFDAITTNRPYQNAYSAEFGVETITKLTGARFDAKVVTAFLRAFQEGSIKIEHTAETSETAAVGA